MKKWILFLGTLVISVIVSGCGAKKIAGDYIGKGSTLTINEDNTWSYYHEGWIEDYEFDGTYEKVDDNTYKMVCEDITLYADLDEDDSLYVYSDDSDWIAESFRRIGSK